MSQGQKENKRTGEQARMREAMFLFDFNISMSSMFHFQRAGAPHSKVHSLVQRHISSWVGAELLGTLSFIDITLKNEGNCGRGQDTILTCVGIRHGIRLQAWPLKAEERGTMYCASG